MLSISLNIDSSPNCVQPHLEKGDKSMYIFEACHILFLEFMGCRLFQISYLFSYIFLCTYVNLIPSLAVIMPPSALDRLAFLQIEYPMLFKLSNPAAGRVTHCGVLEFVADEGFIYLPYWMMENMLLLEGDIVQVKNASLSKGTFVKLQPHTKDFLDISNPKAVLETTLRSFSCLTTGDTIMVAYNNKQFYINVVETKPSSAVSIIETDCEVDFAPPLDYKEPEKPSGPSPAKKPRTEVEEEPAKKVAKFSAFAGSGRRLDGKPSTATNEASSGPVSRATEAPSSSASTQHKESETPSSSTATTTKRCGKLVFGSSAEPVVKGTPKVCPFEMVFILS